MKYIIENETGLFVSNSLICSYCTKPSNAEEFDSYEEAKAIVDRIKASYGNLSLRIVGVPEPAKILFHVSDDEAEQIIASNDGILLTQLQMCNNVAAIAYLHSYKHNIFGKCVLQQQEKVKIKQAREIEIESGEFSGHRVKQGDCSFDAFAWKIIDFKKFDCPHSIEELKLKRISSDWQYVEETLIESESTYESIENMLKAFPNTIIVSDQWWQMFMNDKTTRGRLTALLSMHENGVGIIARFGKNGIETSLVNDMIATEKYGKAAGK